MDWKYNKETETWVCGNENDGCGVYYRSWKCGNSSPGWDVTIVIAKEIISLGPFTSRSMAMQKAEEEYERLAVLV